ncbi:MAG: dipeptidase [Cryobacterium sp.]
MTADFVRALLAETPLIDGHNDLPSALRKTAGYSVDGLDGYRDELNTDLLRLRAGQVGAQFWSVWVPSHIGPSAAVVATLEQIDAVHRLIAAYPATLAFATTAADVERVFASGRIASLIGIEGGHCMAESLGALRMFARLGVRYMTLTHNDDTEWAASATGVRQTTGLDAAGVAIVREMNRIGMMVDASHTAESTQLDALATTSAPVIFSHSSCRSVTNHPRNVSDVVLKKLAENDGVVQVTFVPEFVSRDYAAWEERFTLRQDELGLGQAPAHYAAAPRPGESADAARQSNARPAVPANGALESWVRENPSPHAQISDVADHLDHARDVAGIDHVGIGSDFDGTTVFPRGLDNVSTYPSLFEELREHKWSAADLRKLAGQNVLRVMRGVEDAATEPLWPHTP